MVYLEKQILWKRIYSLCTVFSWDHSNFIVIKSEIRLIKSFFKVGFMDTKAFCKTKHFNLPDWFTSEIDKCKISLIKEHFSFTGTLPLFDPWNLGCPKHAQGFSFSSFGLAVPSSQFLRCCIPKLGLLRENTIFIIMSRIQVEVITSLSHQSGQAHKQNITKRLPL